MKACGVLASTTGEARLVRKRERFIDKYTL
jgi:hypothetical protein